jgi:hypothetical protein
MSDIQEPADFDGDWYRCKLARYGITLDVFKEEAVLERIGIKYQSMSLIDARNEAFEAYHPEVINDRTN